MGWTRATRNINHGSMQGARVFAILPLGASASTYDASTSRAKMSSATDLLLRYNATACDSRPLLESVRAAADGAQLSPDAACELLRCDDEVLAELLAAARAVKQQFRPGIVTYSRKVFIPL